MSGRRFTDKHKLQPENIWQLPSNHVALRENRTLFPSTVVPVLKNHDERLLISGKNNRKLGEFVEKGRFKGYAFYSLSLEERATCPDYCEVRAACYGNSMQFARRNRIVNDDVFFEILEDEISELAKTHVGVLIRLHVLGDFPSVEYVAFWADIMSEYPNVACYGYTHRHPLKSDGDEIGQAIAGLKSTHPDRFRIRYSRSTMGVDTASVIDFVPDGKKLGDGIICPAQTDDTGCCATCAMCWEATKPVLFIKHGRPVQREAAKVAEAVNSARHKEDDPDILRDRIKQLEGEISDTHWMPAEWGLTQSEARILNVLALRPMVTFESLHAALYGNDIDGGAEPSTLKVFVHKIRNKVGPIGIVIEAIHGVGWRLSPESAVFLNCIKEGKPYNPLVNLGSAIVEAENKALTRPIIPIELPPGMVPNKLESDRPDVRMVRVADMQIETSYQRSLSTKSVKLIRQIITNWDWSRFKPPIVSEADGGRYNVVDGQHTAIAAASHPQIAFLPCVVIDAQTVKQRAASFVSHNTNRVAMTSFQIFMGRAAAGDPVASDLVEIIKEERGIIPHFYPKRGDAAAGEIIGIGNLEELYRGRGRDVARRCVRVVVKSRITPAGALVFRALNLLLAREDNYASKVPDDILIEALESIEDFERAASKLAAATDMPKYRAGLDVLIAAIGRVVDARERKTKEVA